MIGMGTLPYSAENGKAEKINTKETGSCLWRARVDPIARDHYTKFYVTQSILCIPL